MKTKTKNPTIDHEAFRNDMVAVMDKHAGALDASEMLALAAYTTGQIMARAIKNLLDDPEGRGFATGLHIQIAKEALKRYAEIHPTTDIAKAVSQ